MSDYPIKAPTTRHVAKPNRNDQGSDVVRPRYAAFASVGCTELEAAPRKVSRIGIIGTARAQKRLSKQSGTSICCRAWHVNPEKDVLAAHRCLRWDGLHFTSGPLHPLSALASF